MLRERDEVRLLPRSAITAASTRWRDISTAAPKASLLSGQDVT